MKNVWKSLFWGLSITMVVLSSPPVFAELEEADDEFIDSDFFRYDNDNSFLENFFDGTSLGIRYRLEERNDTIDINRLQFQIKMKGNIPITDQLDLILQPQTGGDRWSSGWGTDIPLDDDDGTETELSFRFRRIFLEGKPNENILWELGAMPSKSKGVMSTPLGVDSDGWVDGARVMIFTNTPEIERINVTAGSLDLSDADFFHRNWNPFEDGYFQIQTRGTIVDRFTYYAEYNRIQDENQMRGVFNIDVDDMIGPVASDIYIEQLIGMDDGIDDIGRTIGMMRKREKYKIQAAYVVNDQSPLARQLTAGPTRPPGKMLFTMIEKNAGSRGLSLFLRLRHCIGGECDGDFRYELGIRKKLSRS